MTDRENENELAQLEHVNAELSRSLDKCRTLLSDCRSRLIANSNEVETTARDEENRRQG